MDRAYYGPTAMAKRALNRLLDLPATGQEQDWEIELADPSKVSAMLQLLRRGTLDLEAQTALGLLVLYSLEEAAASGQKVNLVAADVRSSIEQWPEMRERLRFYMNQVAHDPLFDVVLG